MTDDDDILAAARAGFLDEAAELLKQLEEALLVMETDPENSENLNAAFRAAHTIKGTSGLFGCDAVVSFTHDAETLMEALRSGVLKVHEGVIAALLQSRDQMERLLEEVKTGVSDPEVAALSASIGATLRGLIGAPATTTASAAVQADDVQDLPAEPQGAGANTSLWHLSLRFGPDALRNGLDPLAFIRYLGRLGEISHLRLLSDTLPALDALDSESCHLGFEIGLRSAAPFAEIDNVFDFARDDCDIAILAPDASAAQYAELLTRRCGEDADAREALLSLWERQEVALQRRQASERATQAAEATQAAAALPEIERRVGDDASAPGGDRRGNPPERRDGAKDRRNDQTRFIPGPSRQA